MATLFERLRTDFFNMRFLRFLSPVLSEGRWALTIFLLVWSALVILPLMVLVAFSFFQTRFFMTVYQPSFATWTDLFASGRFEVTLRTLRIALTVTAIDLIIGFPFAYWLAKVCVGKATRAVMLALLTIPFFIDLSSRIIVWAPIFDEHGLVNSVLLDAHLIGHPLRWLLFTEWPVHFAMILTYFPMMVLPIYLAINAIDETLLAACRDLGGSPVHVLADIVLPLSLPGVLGGIVFTLGSALAAWVEPTILGGGFVDLLSNSVESAYSALRVPMVAALSAFVVILLGVLLVASLVVMRRFVDFGDVFRSIKE